MKKVLLDACVLYPTVMREVLLSVAQAGVYQPLWSPRILEEWARASARHGPEAEVLVRGEIARLSAHWPAACVHPRSGDLARLWLPDPNDVHVLAAAIAGSADVLVTQNRKDFPRHTLREEGVERESADLFLYQLWLEWPEQVFSAVASVQATASQMDNAPTDLRHLLKKARLPRLAKAVAAQP